ncbi:MAG: hypothetical protein COA43_07650 [Robiginitomaculum sp.]|nr:MAG: hypothetical protein COA43_07650 [Robiginitomaculum sp.]
MCTPIAKRGLADWLLTQKRVIGGWRDEIADTCSADKDLIESLETHYNWLSDELVRLSANEM